MYLQKVICIKTFFSHSFFIVFYWRPEGQQQDPDPLVTGMDPQIRIRIHTKMSWICNTAIRPDTVRHTLKYQGTYIYIGIQIITVSNILAPVYIKYRNLAWYLVRYPTKFAIWVHSTHTSYKISSFGSNLLGSCRLFKMQRSLHSIIGTGTKQTTTELACVQIYQIKIEII